MGEILWMTFLEEEIEDLQIVILTIGINGLLSAFENWLKDNGHLNQSDSVKEN